VWRRERALGDGEIAQSYCFYYGGCGNSSSEVVRVAVQPKPIPQSAGQRRERDRGIGLLLVFFGATLVMVVGATLVGVVDQWWVLVPVMLVDLVVTLSVIATILGLMGRDD
jgi:fatty acid desaturase